MKKIIKRTLLIIFALLITAGCIYIAPKAVKVWQLSRKASDTIKASDESTFKNTKTTLVYDSDGAELCKIKSSKALYYVEYEDIPKTLAYAFVVTEDRDFFTHSGIDIKAIVRAAITNQQNNKIVQGASTITQQLARNMFLSYEVTWDRKIEEMFLAWEMEKKYDKEQILEYYLNNIYFGSGYYGVEAAARGYFSKSVGELTLSEQVFIAAIPNNPTRYNPHKNFDKTLKRRDLVLDQMYENDIIGGMDYNQAKEETITLNPEKTTAVNDSVVTYVRHCATESLMSQAGFSFRYSFSSNEDWEGYNDLYDIYYTRCQQQLLSGGYTVYTSFNMELQDALQKAVDENLSEHTELSDSGVYKMQGAATCIDNTTGNVVAIVGSRSQNLGGFGLNRAYQSYRQPGSSIKPLSVYLPYLQKGNTPDTMVNDVKTADGPSNIDNEYSGWITLRQAVKTSKNTMAWEIYKEITPAVGVGFLQQLGFKKVWVDKDYIAGSLGGFTYGVTTEEMAGGFATIENDGIYRRPTCIVKIFDSVGNEVVNESGREVRVYESNASRMMTDMLRTAMEPGGTGNVGVVDGVVMAAKSGTTSSNKDKWFCGFSRYYTTAVWMGYDYPKDVQDHSSVSGIYRQFMAAAHKGKPAEEFLKYQSGANNQPETESETESESDSETDSEDSSGFENESSWDGSSESESSGELEGGNGGSQGGGNSGSGSPETSAGSGSMPGGDTDADIGSGGDIDAGNIGNLPGADVDADGTVGGDTDA